VDKYSLLAEIRNGEYFEGRGGGKLSPFIPHSIEIPNLPTTRMICTINPFLKSY
jgi:hypothetical protein